MQRMLGAITVLLGVLGLFSSYGYKSQSHVATGLSSRLRGKMPTNWSARSQDQLAICRKTQS